jgi:hypothetical protein
VNSNPIGSTKIDVIQPRILAERIVIAAALILALLYSGDYLFLRIRMIHPKPSDPFESITVPRILAIPEKSGKTEYEIDALNPEQTVTCVHSLFPHFGYSPCWYVKPRMNRPIPMMIVPFSTVLRRK